jgi:hypothetical protein
LKFRWIIMELRQDIEGRERCGISATNRHGDTRQHSSSTTGSSK